MTLHLKSEISIHNSTNFRIRMNEILFLFFFGWEFVIYKSIKLTCKFMRWRGRHDEVMLHPPYSTSDLLTYRPTATANLRQLFICIIWGLRQFLDTLEGWILDIGNYARFLFFLVSRLNTACSPLVLNPQSWELQILD